MTGRTERHVLHLLSDSTGETVSAAAGAVISQFDGLELTRRVHVFTRTRRDVDAALQKISDEPGLVVYTLLDESLAARLRVHAPHFIRSAFHLLLLRAAYHTAYLRQVMSMCQHPAK